MTDDQREPACCEKSYLIKPSQLPLSCPTDEMIVWNAHPKVYLDLESKGIAICPYCSTRYLLEHE